MKDILKKIADNKEILQILKNDKSAALNYFNSQIKSDFEKYYELYEGKNIDRKKYRMPESSFISRDVLVTIRRILPDISKLLLSSNPVNITARSGEDEELASKMNSVINYQVTVLNPFHKVFMRLFTDSLITGCGVLKVIWKKEMELKTVEKEAALDEIEKLEKSGIKVDYRLENPFNEEAVYKIKYSYEAVKVNQPVFELLPYEEFLYDPKASDVQDAEYIIHRKLVSYDFLKRKEKEGVYRNVDKITQYVSCYEDDVTGGIRNNIYETPSQKARRKVILNEYWGRVDINNDGLLENVIITYSGDTILSVEENSFDMYPFFVFSPFYSSDSLAGRGIAELAENAQVTKTALVREILENTRRNNNRKIFYKVDDLLNPSQMVTNEQYVAVRDNADINNIFAPEPFEPVSSNTFSLIEYFDKECQRVTGITDMKQGVDSIENKTATEAVIRYESSNSQIQAIAVNFAESLKEVYRFILYQNKKFIDNRQVFRLLNDVIEINGEDIRDVDFDVNVSVSFSTGSEETKRRALNNALSMMIEIGEPRSLTDSIKIRNVLAKILEANGLKDSDKYLISEQSLREAKK